MSVSSDFQGCKALLRIVKRRYVNYHAFFLSAARVEWKFSSVQECLFAQDCPSVFPHRESKPGSQNFAYKTIMRQPVCVWLSAKKSKLQITSLNCQNHWKPLMAVTGLQVSCDCWSPAMLISVWKYSVANESVKRIDYLFISQISNATNTQIER